MTKRAADGELLLLAAGKIAAAPPEHVLQDRKEIENLVGDEALGALHRRIARLQIFADAEQRKNFASLRHIADAAPGAGMRRQFRNILALPHDPAAGDRLLADDRAQQRGLCRRRCGP